jgi:elongation factor Tu
VGVKNIVVFVNKCDLVDSEVQELVELEIRELLTDFGFEGDKTPVVFGSASRALQGDPGELGTASVMRLMTALDDHVELPKRDTAAPFLLPVDSAFSVSGRGTVVVGTLKVNGLNGLFYSSFKMNPDGP